MSGSSSQDKGNGQPRRSGLKPMGTLMWRVASPALRKRGLAEARIVTDWQEIVGPFLARATSPDRLKRDAADQPGTLHVRVTGPVATEVQHLAPQIVERVNSYFGYTAVRSLRIIQAPPRAGKRRRKPASPPDAAAQRAVETRVAGVEDDELRQALTRLGMAIEARTPAKK